MLTKLRSWMLAAVAVALIAVVIAAQGGEPGDAVASTDPSPSMIATDALGAFDQPRSGADELPDTARAEVEDLGPEGALIESSVRSLSWGAWSIYLTPAPDSVCLSIADPDGGASAHCATLADLDAGIVPPAAVLEGCELVTRERPPVCSSALIYGLAPDGVKQVAVAVESGPSPVAEVHHNAYLVRVPLTQEPTAVTLQGPRGEMVVPAPIPQS